METLRTPDERFLDLPGYPFAPHYTDVPDGEGGQLRVHHVEAGPAEGEIVLCLHGQPTWSYLYRKMIPIFAEAGRRAIAPDFVGFGRSDKPTRREDYTYARHVSWMSAWLEALDLRDITLVCQDWGGLIGLRLVAADPDRFARVVAANTGLPDAAGVPEDMAPALHKIYESLPVVKASELPERFQAKEGPPGFLYWRKFCAETPELRVGELLGIGGGRVTPELVAAYDAPFPDERYLAGARQFPSLVPVFPDDPAVPDNRKAWEVLGRFEKPFLTAFSDGDPVTRGADARFRKDVPGAQGQEHVTIRGAGHFLQEEKGEELAAAVLRFMERNPIA
ncbi:MAG: haloalkane dehalogenase [Myxococcota bacterium]